MLGVSIQGGSGSGQQDQIVTVKTGDVRAVQDFAASDGFVTAALNKIDAGVFQGGLSLSLTEFGREVELTEERQEVIRTTWQQAASRINREQLVVGYAVVRPVPHSKFADEWEPYVVPYTKYELQFVESSQQPRQYFVNYLDYAYPAASVSELSDRRTVRASNGDDTESGAPLPPPPKKSKTLPRATPTVAFDASVMRLQYNENNAGYPMMDGGRSHLIFVRFHPTPDGSLQSPVALLRGSMTSFQHMLKDEFYASFWRAHPSHFVEITKDFFNKGGGGGGGTTGRETFGTGLFAEADIRMDADRFRYERNEAEYVDFKLAVAAAEQGRQVTMRDKDAARRALYAMSSATHYHEPANPNSAVAPSDYHNVVLGANQHIVAGPKPEGNVALEKIRDIIMDIAFALLNIVPQVMNPQRTKQAGADPQTVLREWDSALQAVQRQLAPVLNECYQAAYAQQHSDYVNGVYSLFKSEAKRLEDEASAAYDPESTQNILSRRQFESLLDRNGHADLVKALRNERKRTVRQTIAKSVQVSFSFQHVPRNTLADLRALFDWFVISEEVFCRMAGALMGINESDLLLDKKDREKERKERLETQTTALDAELQTKQKYMPPDKDASAGSGFGKGLTAKSGGGGGAPSSKKK